MGGMCDLPFRARLFFDIVTSSGDDTASGTQALDIKRAAIGHPRWDSHEVITSCLFISQQLRLLRFLIFLCTQVALQATSYCALTETTFSAPAATLFVGSFASRVSVRATF